MTRSVVHIYDPDNRLGGFELLNMIRVTRGPDITLHVDRGDTYVDIVHIGQDGAATGREIETTTGIGGCGCP